MALPSILLLLAFVGGVFAFSAFALAARDRRRPVRQQSNRSARWSLAAAAAIAAAAAWLHWRRFKVPITVAAGVAALVGAGPRPDRSSAVVARRRASETGRRSVAALVLGIGVFLLAMRWDGSDPKRETRRSDVAFWLHLLAAPMIVHPIFTLLGLTEGTATPARGGDRGRPLYIVLGLAALAIDRRALLVSALAYVLYALTACSANMARSSSASRSPPW